MPFLRAKIVPASEKGTGGGVAKEFGPKEAGKPVLRSGKFSAEVCELARPQCGPDTLIGLLKFHQQVHQIPGDTSNIAVSRLYSTSTDSISPVIVSSTTNVFGRARCRAPGLMTRVLPVRCCLAWCVWP